MPGGYESHFPILAACIARTTGPILELGVGEGSTPMIHYSAPNRFRVSADTDLSWLRKFAEGYYSPRQHEFIHVDATPIKGIPDVTVGIQAWRKFSMIETCQWGCVIVDCAPGEARHELAIRLANRAHFVILHDSETDYQAGGNYMYSEATVRYKHVSEFRRFRPYTMVCSNVELFSIEECDKTWTPV